MLRIGGSVISTEAIEALKLKNITTGVINNSMNNFEDLKITVEDFFLTKHWDAKILIDPYVNYPLITTYIERSFATCFVGERTYEHPDGMFEYFKLKYFPVWLKKRFPIKMAVVKFSFRAIFPDFNPGKFKWMPDVNMNYLEGKNNG